jgi:hypothetical protein
MPLHKLTDKYICQIMQGGISSGYKKFVEQKGLTDETYSADGIALVRISGTSVHNNKALQVDSVFLDLHLFLPTFLNVFEYLLSFIHQILCYQIK